MTLCCPPTLIHCLKNCYSNDQVISPLQSDLFLRDSSLQYRLVNTPSSLLLNGTQCDDPLGCLCGNSNTKVTFFRPTLNCKRQSKVSEGDGLN